MILVLYPSPCLSAFAPHVSVAPLCVCASDALTCVSARALPSSPPPLPPSSIPPAALPLPCCRQPRGRENTAGAADVAEVEVVVGTGTDVAAAMNAAAGAGEVEVELVMLSNEVSAAGETRVVSRTETHGVKGGWMKAGLLGGAGALVPFLALSCAGCSCFCSFFLSQDSQEICHTSKGLLRIGDRVLPMPDATAATSGSQNRTASTRPSPPRTPRRLAPAERQESKT